jgi:hypothetical protein
VPHVTVAVDAPAPRLQQLRTARSGSGLAQLVTVCDPFFGLEAPSRFSDGGELETVFEPKVRINAAFAHVERAGDRRPIPLSSRYTAFTTCSIPVAI